MSNVTVVVFTYLCCCVFRAQEEAKAIIEQYEKESLAYAQILDPNGLAFNVDGFISYMGVRVIAAAKNPVYIGMQSPAKTSGTP